jgi:hypothetical protein
MNSIIEYIEYAKTSMGQSGKAVSLGKAVQHAAIALIVRGASILVETA